jgi:hypothetical protein
MGKDKGYNSSYVYCQVKGWSKMTYETFSNDFGKGFENGMMGGGGENGLVQKDFEHEMFLSSQNIDFPFLFVETLRAFLFPSFFQYFSLSLSLSLLMLHLFEGLGNLMINEEKKTLQFFFQMKWM